MTTTKTIAHRAGQARGLALRAQLAWMLTQLLFWLSVIAGVAAVALWARGRLTAGAPTVSPPSAPSSVPSSAPSTDAVTSDTSSPRLH